MKSDREQIKRILAVVTLAALSFFTIGKTEAQSPNPNLNERPCDYSDLFYMDNGVDPTQILGRFGNANGGRQFGPPAGNLTQPNWVADHTDCSATDPVRRDVRILATTGGYIDDGSGNATDFISLIGFLTSQDAFETTYSRNVGAINGGLEGVQQNPGETISIVQSTDPTTGLPSSVNPRGVALQDIVSNFEAYPAVRQRLANGVLSPTPCGSMFDTNLPDNTPCFSVASVATPNLREDWRFASNRNAMDGSDGNDPVGALSGAVKNAPFGYFCDDLVGIWINTYFWFTHHAVGNTATNEKPEPLCTAMLNQLRSMHGNTLDGTPVVQTADELNFLEGSDVGAEPLGPNFPNPPVFGDGEGCMAEGQLDTGGADAPGAVWDICPTIPDPRNGAISKDAFLDSVKFASGFPVDVRFNINFLCLQGFGQFCNINVNLQNLGINPNPTKVGTQTNVTTLFQNTTSTTLTGVTLTANIVNSSGTVVATKSAPGNTLGPGQTDNVTIVWTPTAKGTYTVQGTASNSAKTGIGLNPFVAVATVN